MVCSLKKVILELLFNFSRLIHCNNCGQNLVRNWNLSHKVVSNGFCLVVNVLVIFKSASGQYPASHVDSDKNMFYTKSHILNISHHTHFRMEIKPSENRLFRQRIKNNQQFHLF